MVAQSRGVDMKTGAVEEESEGFLKSVVKSAVGGESFFVNTYTASGSGGWVSLSFGSRYNGVPPSPRKGAMQGGAFMACTPIVDMDTKF